MSHDWDGRVIFSHQFEFEVTKRDIAEVGNYVLSCPISTFGHSWMWVAYTKEGGLHGCRLCGASAEIFNDKSKSLEGFPTLY